MTVKELLGPMVRKSPAALDDVNDECSACGTRLKDKPSWWRAYCGIYCSRRCAENHAEFLAGAWEEEKAS